MRSLHRNISTIRIKNQKGKAPDIKSKSIFINQVSYQVHNTKRHEYYQK